MQQQDFQQWGRERPHSQSRKSCIMPGKAMERCGTREGEKTCSLSTDHITRTDRATIFLAGQHGGASFSLRSTIALGGARLLIVQRCSGF